VHNADLTDADYLQVIRYKTAKLFEASAQLGAIISQASASDEKALGQYGMHIGTAFQLIDDVLDLSGDAQEIGKNIGDDLSEGKPTLPLLYAMRHGNAKESAAIKLAIEHGGLADLDTVLNAVERTGAQAYVMGLARVEAQAACDCLAHFNDSPYKQALLALADFATARNH
jgi:octaprenyl-diphosphate synthase